MVYLSKIGVIVKDGSGAYENDLRAFLVADIDEYYVEESKGSVFKPGSLAKCPENHGSLLPQPLY